MIVCVYIVYVYRGLNVRVRPMMYARARTWSSLMTTANESRQIWKCIGTPLNGPVAHTAVMRRAKPVRGDPEPPPDRTSHAYDIIRYCCTTYYILIKSGFGTCNRQNKRKRKFELSTQFESSNVFGVFENTVTSFPGLVNNFNWSPED